MNASTVPASRISPSAVITRAAICHHLLGILVEDTMSNKVCAFHCRRCCKRPTCVADPLILYRCDSPLLSPVDWCRYSFITPLLTERRRFLWSLNQPLSPHRLSLFLCPISILIDSELVRKALWFLHFFWISMFNVEHSLSEDMLSQEILLFSLVGFGEIRDESHEVLGFKRVL